MSQQYAMQRTTQPQQNDFFDLGAVATELDRSFPLRGASHRDVVQYRVYFDGLVAHLRSGRCVGLNTPSQFSDYDGDKECPSLIVLDSSERHVELQL